MWRWARWVVAGLLVVVLAAAIYVLRIDHKARATQREQAVRYGVMIERIRGEYPLGSGLVDVMVQVRKKHIAYSEAGHELLLPLGSDPSYVWYCNNWVTYATLTFDGDGYHESPVFKLQSIDTQVIGGSCL